MLRKILLVDNDKVYLKGFRGQLGLSPVLVLNSSCLLRTMGWYQWLSQFRKDVPLFLIHDFGHILRSEPNEDFHISFRKKALARLSEFLDPKEKAHIIKALEDYRALLQRISETELATVLRKQKASEVFTAGLLAHLFQGLFFEFASMSPLPSAKVNDQVLKELDRFQYLSATQINQFAQTLLYIVRQKKQLLIAVEQVDCESLKLLHLTTTQSNTNNYFLELLQMFSMASAQDVARFSLDLLPSVLETKKSRGTQTYAVDGYASIDNRGPISSLLPTELVYDDDIFDKRYLHKEQFFYAREKDHELKDRLHYFMVDASASMRGLRSMFARGVALAMAKKALLGGDQVIWRYFDSRLYEKKEMQLENMHVPYILSFRGEKGRNTTSVFTELHREVKRFGAQPSKEVVISLFSHGRCMIRPEVVLGIRNHAQLYGVFVLPTEQTEGGGQWSHFDGYELVHATVLEDRAQRQSKALALLDAHKVGSEPLVGSA